MGFTRDKSCAYDFPRMADTLPHLEGDKLVCIFNVVSSKTSNHQKIV